MHNKWDKEELKDYIEKLKDNPNLFAKEFLCKPIEPDYCHSFDRKHYFLKGRCEICGIKYNYFRELIERNDGRFPRRWLCKLLKRRRLDESRL